MERIDYLELCRMSPDRLQSLLKKEDKKLAMVYGNCQITYIIDYLLETKSFVDKYILIVNMPAVQWFGEKEQKHGINQYILDTLGVFIYQHVTIANKYSIKLATKTIVAQLSNVCKTISIPNLYFKGYFPQDIKNKRNVLIGSKWHLNGVVSYGDFVLESFFEKNKSEAELEDYLLSDELFLKEYVILQAEGSLNELKRREQECDIIISDYVEENYKTSYLFYTPNHPTNELTHALCNRILSRLDILPNDTYVQLPQNDKIELVIYPAVYKHLNLTFTKTTFTPCKSLNKEPVDVLNYARNYGYFCFLEYPKENVHDEVPVELYRIVVINTKFVNARSAGSFTVKNSTAHLSLYLDLLSNISNEPIVYIPREYAPVNSFFSTVSTFGGSRNCIIKIGEDGSIQCNSSAGKCVGLIDVCWNI